MGIYREMKDGAAILAAYSVWALIAE